MDIYELIELGDSDELLREVDRLCERHDWAALLKLRDLCRAATERGKTLWGAAGHAEYRMALEATSEFAAPMIEADAGRFVLGPLTEVVASTHTWSELAAFLPSGPLRASVAYERVIRGEPVDLPDTIDEFGIPMALQPWEPSYALATYSAYELLAPAPLLQPLETIDLKTVSAVEFKDATTDALHQLVQPWLSGSNGKVQIASVDGGINEVLSLFSSPSALRLSAGDALAAMQWAAASGGAHGVRTGAAAGRNKLWWALANLSGLDEEWPYPADEIGEYVNEVEWWTWNQSDVNAGWHLRIAVTDPTDGVAHAISASDVV